MEPIISGIQQVGVGVPDVYEAWEWYRLTLGFDVPVFDDPGTADRMLPYTGGKPQSRHAVLAVNMQGGGGLEIWQYTSRTPKAPGFTVQAGDLGIYAAKIRTPDIEKAYGYIQGRQTNMLGEIEQTPEGVCVFSIRDPYGNLLRIEEGGPCFLRTQAVTGGVTGAVVGVTDMDASIGFYRDILGYDLTAYDKTGTFADLKVLPGGEGRFRRVLLRHTKPRQGAFSRMLGPSAIELLQSLDRAPVKIYEGRYWGDLGFIQVCYDIRGMKELKAFCKEKGHPFTVDSNPEADSGEQVTFDMGEAAGRFGYIEDPDGTLIEFVETHRLPIVKKLGWYLDLRKRQPQKPLPDWMLKTLRWNRKK